MMPAVHWFADRVQSPATGIGSAVALPGTVAPVVSAPVPGRDPPESLKVSALRSPPTHCCEVCQVPVPCS